METKFTKGEWYFDEDAVYTKGKIEANIICESPFKGFLSYKNWESNAKLITAAPDLYYALIGIIECAKEMKSLDSAILLAEKAIKKATE